MEKINTASNHGTEPQELTEMLKKAIAAYPDHGTFFLLIALVNNPELPEKAFTSLEPLITVHETLLPIEIVCAIAENPNCPSEMLTRLCWHSNSKVRYAASQNENCPEESQVSAILNQNN